MFEENCKNVKITPKYYEIFTGSERRVFKGNSVLFWIGLIGLEG
jgi:hypothetical protein